jgi:hypothetical protein
MRRWMKIVLEEAGQTDRHDAFVWSRRHRAQSAQAGDRIRTTA